MKSTIIHKTLTEDDRFACGFRDIDLTDYIKNILNGDKVVVTVPVKPSQKSVKLNLTYVESKKEKRLKENK